ncbi:hypothetical protein Hanom_Chr16g01486921 [Helianthus anomalus]
MMTANVGTSYEWKFDGEDEDEGFVADDGSMSMDMESFMSILEETLPEDCSQMSHELIVVKGTRRLQREGPR